jgi:hypothetical protein
MVTYDIMYHVNQITMEEIENHWTFKLGKLIDMIKKSNSDYEDFLNWWYRGVVLRHKIVRMPRRVPRLKTACLDIVTTKERDYFNRVTSC